MDELEQIPVDEVVQQGVDGGASFDGIFDGIMGLAGSSGMVGVVIVAVLGLIAFLKFGKKTKQLNKIQKEDVKVYKENKKESLKEIKQIDKKAEDIINKIVKNSEEEDDIEMEIATGIIDVVDEIEEIKKDPTRRTIPSANERLRIALQKAKERRGH
jgi:hypothetical protein